MALVKKDLDYCKEKMPDNPLAQNANIEYLIVHKQFSRALKLSQKYLKTYPANHWQYFLSGRINRVLNKTFAAEKVLQQGLDLQGTDLQKKTFHKELGLLLLEHKDRVAEQYLRAVIRLEPQNARLIYLRASALYRLGRYLEAMKNVNKARAIKKWSALNELKAKLSLVLGNQCFEKKDYDRTFTYISTALNLRPNDFNINKKKLMHEARQQLNLAGKMAASGKGKDFLLLGTEYLAQGFRKAGADAYEQYIKNNPDAPEANHFKKMVKKMRGEYED